MSREEILQERLDRVAAIVDVIEQHGDLEYKEILMIQDYLIEIDEQAKTG